jgi:hypothetical protein
MSDVTREAALAELYRRDAMQPEQRAAYEELIRRGQVAPEINRGAGERFIDNIVDGFQQNPIMAGYRRGIAEATQLAEGEPLGEVLDPRRGLLVANPARTLGLLTGTALTAYDRSTFARVGREYVDTERQRRRSYQARAQADPIQNAGDAAAYVAGQVVGAIGDPTNVIAPGRSLAARTLGNGALNAIGDVSTQGDDIASGVRDEYDPVQTGGAALLGAGLPVAFDAVGAAARPVSDFVRRAFTDPVTPRATAGEGITVTGPDGVEVDVPAAPRTPSEAVAPPEPEFGIVQRVDRRSPLRDAVSRVREGELPQMVGEWMAKSYTAVVSQQHPLVRMVDDLRSQTEALTGQPEDIAPGSDPRMLARGRYDWTSIGHADLMHGVHGYRELTPSSPALADVVSAVAVRAKRANEAPEAAIQRFNEYMVARRATEEWDRFSRGEIPNEPVARTKEQAEAFIAKIDSDDPEFRELSEAVNQFAAAQLKKDLDAGFVTRQAYDEIVASRQFYVPLRRVMDDGTGGGQSPSNKSSGIQRFKGSQRDVVDPVSVLINRAYRQAQRVRQNEVNLAVVRMAERLEAARAAAGDADPSNGWIRRINTADKVELSARKIGKAAADRDGLEGAARDGKIGDIEDALDGEGVTIWKPGEINDAGRPILYVWRDGKREAYEIIDPDWATDVFEALGGMSKPMSDMFTDLVAVPTTILAQTITRDPAFLFANFIRDQVSTWISTDVGFKPGEGALGVADELGQTDLTRLYGISGGISGGAQTAMLGDVFNQADTLALTKKGVQAKYFSDFKGLLATSEITETGSRLRLFKRAFDRAKAAGHSDYDALIQASFTARDVMDFGRVGSRLHTTRRLVTFLNSQVQGLDKFARTLSANGGVGGRVALKDALRPLFGRNPTAPMRAEDAAALKLAGKAWTKVAALAVFGLGISALYHDDPDYQEANERMRATHWVIPWGENLVKIPKPFEWAVLSTVAERAFEATIGQDERAWGRLVRGLGYNFAPPTEIPLLTVVGDLRSNTNSYTGRPIVPEYLQEMPPELQYQHWNSQFSRWLGDLLNVSPAKIDYAITGFGGPVGAYALAAMDAADPERPSGTWTDAPVVRRFINPSQRGSQDKREFYDRAGSRTSRLQQVLNGIKEDQENGRTQRAQSRLAELKDEAGRLYVVSQLGDTPVRRLHPLERARVVGQEASRLIGELNGALPRDDGAPLPTMSRRERQSIEEAVERLAIAEMRNAMIATRQPGFQNRAMEDRDGLWEDLRDLNRAVADEYERRLATGRDRAYDYAAVMEFWPQAEQRLRAEGSAADLSDLANDAAGRTMRWGERGDEYEEAAATVFRP